MAQKTGALIFDEQTDRYDIRFDLADYYGGLHCGECLEVFAGGKWKPTRIEYGDNWYLVGIRAEDLNGLRVRILCTAHYGATGKLAVPFFMPATYQKAVCRPKPPLPHERRNKCRNR